ncbi:MAG TPA: EAL domain-containing protein [Trinickia sp.]|uniref:putative bifunctional diguanylate cyclase/phosphodiesterase n=1 Tax=Trinickia sp. TaxID=2571163 RepID=UPI002BC206F5|nr:EAL domain-containing protein [Trinickia sp.]HVW48891.1 EAL domain-containing protein [Trinickia sp.]
MESHHRSICARLAVFVCILGALVLSLSAIAGILLVALEADRRVTVLLVSLALAAAVAAALAAALLVKARKEITFPLLEASAFARHDPLTGLVNRRVFEADLRKAAELAKVHGDVYQVLVIDLDRLRAVNDLQGHAVGDAVLCEVAKRVRQVVRKRDTVARLAGDEFAVIARTEGPRFVDESMHLAARLLQAITRPIVIAPGKTDITIGACAGIALAPNDGLDEDTLLHAAYIAMHRAKDAGEGTIRFFERRMDEELYEQAQLEADLKAAVKGGTIQPYYQPLIEMREQRIWGFEILARWRHPTRGAVPPDAFIPVCERLGLTSALTACVLRQACKDVRQWLRPDVKLALNISPNQLKDASLPAQILAILREEGMPTPQLEVEITETALVGDIDAAKAIFDAFHEAGIEVSLDDFGTGYSSLYHLRELKFDKMKIDKSFVQSMQRNDESEKIVDAILGLAKSLGMRVVAEGIEDPAACEKLKQKGCEYGQGYYFGKAIAAVDAGAQLCRH